MPEGFALLKLEDASRALEMLDRIGIELSMAELTSSNPELVSQARDDVGNLMQMILKAMVGDVGDDEVPNA